MEVDKNSHWWAKQQYRPPRNTVWFLYWLHGFSRFAESFWYISISKNILFFNLEFNFKMTIYVVRLSRYLHMRQTVQRGKELITSVFHVKNHISLMVMMRWQKPELAWTIRSVAWTIFQLPERFILLPEQFFQLPEWKRQPVIHGFRVRNKCIKNCWPDHNIILGRSIVNRQRGWTLLIW